MFSLVDVVRRWVGHKLSGHLIGADFMNFFQSTVNS